MPYGATCNVYCTQSSKITQAIINYENENSYSTQPSYLGIGLNEFIESSIEPMEMTFSYNKKNGILVEIITNLEVITNENIISYSTGHYSIVNDNWLSNGNGEFTISNETWYNGNKTETPYIYLCFNNVKIENCFLDEATDKVSNGFKFLTYDNTKLYPRSNNYNLKATLARYITISWNKAENNVLLYGEDGGMNEFHNRYYIYSFTNGEQARLFYSDQHGTISKGFSTTVPRMDGGENVKQYIGPYFIGFVINIGEVGEWMPGTQYYIKSGNYYHYDLEGYRENIFLYSKDAAVDTDNSIPVLYSIKYYGESNKGFYYATSENISTKPYFSPSNGIELESDWDLSCDPYEECPNYCTDCDADCPTQGDDTDNTYTVLVINGPHGGVTGWIIRENGQNSDYIFVPNGEYSNYSKYGSGSYRIGESTGVAASSYVYEEQRYGQDCGGGCSCDTECDCDAYDDCPYYYPCPNNVACPQFQGDWCDPYYYDCPTDY